MKIKNILLILLSLVLILSSCKKTNEDDELNKLSAKELLDKLEINEDTAASFVGDFTPHYLESLDVLKGRDDIYEKEEILRELAVSTFKSDITNNSASIVKNDKNGYYQMTLKLDTADILGEPKVIEIPFTLAKSYSEMAFLSPTATSIAVIYKKLSADEKVGLIMTNYSGKPVQVLKYSTEGEEFGTQVYVEQFYSDKTMSVSNVDFEEANINGEIIYIKKRSQKCSLAHMENTHFLHTFNAVLPETLPINEIFIGDIASTYLYDDMRDGSPLQYIEKNQNIGVITYESDGKEYYINLEDAINFTTSCNLEELGIKGLLAGTYSLDLEEKYICLFPDAQDNKKYYILKINNTNKDKPSYEFLLDDKKITFTPDCF